MYNYKYGYILFCLFNCFDACVPVNNYSVIHQVDFLSGWTSNKQQINCLAQRHRAVIPPVVSLELATLQSPVLKLYQLSHCTPQAFIIMWMKNVWILTKYTWICAADVCLFGLRFYIAVNSHVETVSSPNPTFSRASLTKQLTSTSCCTYFRL